MPQELLDLFIVVEVVDGYGLNGPNQPLFKAMDDRVDWVEQYGSESPRFWGNVDISPTLGDGDDGSGPFLRRQRSAHYV